MSVNVGVGATGTSLATAYQIASQVQNIQVSTCSSSNYAINLPVSPISGVVYSIRNDGAYNLSVFPGTTASAINGLAVNTAFIIAPNAQCSFIQSNDLEFTAVLQWYAMGYMGPAPIIPVSGALTLTQANSGSIYAINPGTASFTITLPAPTLGLKFEFLLSAVTDGTHTVTIASPTSSVVFGLIENANTTYGPKASASGSTNIVFGTSTAGKVGDRCSVVCDGTNYSVLGSTSSTVVTALQFS